jgi:hypothetical protein
MSSARYWHTATRLKTGKVLVAGGHDVTTGWSATAELFDPASGTFVSTSGMTLGREKAAAALLPDGRVLIAGGLERVRGAGFVETFDPATSSFSSSKWTGPNMSDLTVSALPAGGVVVAGGWNEYAVCVWSPSTGICGLSLPADRARDGHTATLMADGRILIVGGSYATNDGVYVIDTGELYKV